MGQRFVIPGVAQRRPGIQEFVVSPTGTKNAFNAGSRPRWREIKSWFSRRISPEEQRPQGRINKGERGIWQRRYWEHTLRDDEGVDRHTDYIHYNPVKHGHVARVADWPFSSFHRYVRRGIYPLDWGGDDVLLEGNFRE